MAGYSNCSHTASCRTTCTLQSNLLKTPTEPRHRQSAAHAECHGLDNLETPDSRSPLSRIMHSLKSFTASCANKLLSRSGRFWQKESFDHWIRDIDELERIVN